MPRCQTEEESSGLWLYNFKQQAQPRTFVERKTTGCCVVSAYLHPKQLPDSRTVLKYTVRSLHCVVGFFSRCYERNNSLLGNDGTGGRTGRHAAVSSLETRFAYTDTSTSRPDLGAFRAFSCRGFLSSRLETD